MRESSMAETPKGVKKVESKLLDKLSKLLGLESTGIPVSIILSETRTAAVHDHQLADPC